MIQWMKEHPYLTGSFVVLVIILYLIYRNRSTGASSPSGVVTVGPSDTIQAQALAANAGIQAATLQAQTRIAGYNAAVNAKNLDVSGAVQIAQLQSNVQLQSILTGGEVTDTRTAAQLQLGLANVGAQVAIASIETGGTIPFSVVGRGTVQAQQTADATETNKQIVAAVGAMPTASGGGNPASMPAGLAAIFAQNNPVYTGPGANPSFYQGYLSGENAKVPSAGGYASYASYRAAVDAGLVNPAPGGFVNNAAVGYDQAMIDAANYSFINDPNSCHNVVCDASGHPVGALPPSSYVPSAPSQSPSGLSAPTVPWSVAVPSSNPTNYHPSEYV